MIMSSNKEMIPDENDVMSEPILKNRKIFGRAAVSKLRRNR